MNKEEIEELKDFTIDLTDIDELALGLEVCSKKSNMVIQEFVDTIIQLQQENQELKLELSGYRQSILEDKDMLGLKEENQELKKQLEYLRSGEYYNQLRFERDMLQYVADNGKVSKEDKEFIDMTHRNTELLEVIEEVREYAKNHFKTMAADEEAQGLLQILDKANGELTM